MSTTAPAPSASPVPIIDPARLATAEVASAPFAFLVARDQLPADAQQTLDRDFPR